MWLLSAIAAIALGADAKKLERACDGRGDAEACFAAGETWLATADSWPIGIEGSGLWYGLACIRGYKTTCNEASVMAMSGSLPADLRPGVVAQLKAGCEDGLEQSCRNLATAMRNGTKMRVTAEDVWVEGLPAEDAAAELQKLVGLVGNRGTLIRSRQRLVQIELEPKLPTERVLQAVADAALAGYTMVDLIVGEQVFRGLLADLALQPEELNHQLRVYMDSQGVLISGVGLGDIKGHHIPCVANGCATPDDVNFAEVVRMTHKIGDASPDGFHVVLDVSNEISADLLVAIGSALNDGGGPLVGRVALVLPIELAERAGYQRPSVLGGASMKPGLVDPEFTIIGALANEVIEELATADRGGIQTCFPVGEAGRVVMRFIVGSDGKATGVTPRKNTFANDMVADCLAGRIGNWVFLAPKGGRAIVTYPFDSSTP
jgi:hypothetical protein